MKDRTHVATGSEYRQKTTNASILAADQLLSPKQAAAEIGFSEVSLQRWRIEGKGPPYVKIGKRRVGYRVGALRQWLTNRETTSTADAADRGLTKG